MAMPEFRRDAAPPWMCTPLTGLRRKSAVAHNAMYLLIDTLRDQWPCIAIILKAHSSPWLLATGRNAPSPFFC